jgi:hypothetical protein
MSSTTREIRFRAGMPVTMTGSVGVIDLGRVFADAADMLELPVDDASRVGAVVCAMLGGYVRDGMPDHVCAELIAAHERNADRLASFSADTDPDAPDGTHGVVA